VQHRGAHTCIPFRAPIRPWYRGVPRTSMTPKRRPGGFSGRIDIEYVRPMTLMPTIYYYTTFETTPRRRITSKSMLVYSASGHWHRVEASCNFLARNLTLLTEHLSKTEKLFGVICESIKAPSNRPHTNVGQVKDARKTAHLEPREKYRDTNMSQSPGPCGSGAPVGHIVAKP
jgi:hypothetical protein